MAAPIGNTYAVGNNGGRPPYYESTEQMQSAINSYFDYIKGEKDSVGEWTRYPEPATVTGLVLFLGFSHREALKDYEKKEEFSDIIKNGRTRVEHEYEKRLHGDKNTGAIFALKNMGWSDKTEIDHTTNGKELNTVTVFQLPDNGRNSIQGDTTAERLSDEST